MCILSLASESSNRYSWNLVRANIKSICACTVRSCNILKAKNDLLKPVHCVTECAIFSLAYCLQTCRNAMSWTCVMGQKRRLTALRSALGLPVRVRESCAAIRRPQRNVDLQDTERSGGVQHHEVLISTRLWNVKISNMSVRLSAV